MATPTMTGHIVSDSITPQNQGGRCAASFADGPYRRRVEIRPGNRLVVLTTEGEVLHTEDALVGLPFAIRSLSAETSSFSGTLILVAGGFTPDSSDSRVVTVVTSYRIQPPVYFGGQS